MFILFTLYCVFCCVLGPHLLDDSEFSTQVFADPIIVQVTWGVLDSMANYSLNLSLQFTLVKVDSPECDPPKVSIPSYRYTITTPQNGIYPLCTYMYPLFTLYTSSIYPLCTLYLPSIHPLYTLYVPSMYSICTLYVPSMYSIYPLCTLYVPSIYPLYTLYVPSMYPLYTLYVPSMYSICTL